MNKNITILEEYRTKKKNSIPVIDTSKILIWKCNCGCKRFYLTPAGPYCPKCKIYFDYPEDYY